jgi:anti-anti-sigma factor
MTALTASPDVTTDRRITVIGLGPAFESIDESLLTAGFREALLAAAQTADPPVVVLDLSHTRFFGSSFIEVLFQMWHRLQGKAGCRFALCGLSPYCMEVLKITHLDTLWPVFKNRETAVSELASNG